MLVESEWSAALILKGEEMRSSGQSTDAPTASPRDGRAPVAHRLISFRVALTCLILVIGLTWLAKGTGVKTWVLRTFTQTPPVNAHFNTVAALSAKVRLDCDPLVRFERVQLP